jgi:hypothetical protein
MSVWRGDTAPGSRIVDVALVAKFERAGTGSRPSEVARKIYPSSVEHARIVLRDEHGVIMR